MLSRWPISALCRWVFVALAITIGYLALTPAPPAQLSLGWDKANHALAFAALAFAGDKGFRGAGWHRIRGALALVAYGAAIEIAQYFVPTRSCDWYDLLADISGVGVGICISLALGALGGKFAHRSNVQQDANVVTSQAARGHDDSEGRSNG